MQSLWNFAETALIADIFSTNCAGALFGCKVALQGMKERGRGAMVEASDPRHGSSSGASNP